MKLTLEQVEAMRERIAPLDTAERRQAYREGRFPRGSSHLLHVQNHTTDGMFLRGRGKEAIASGRSPGRFPRAEAVKDLDMRYRWDLYYAGRVSDVFHTGIGGDDYGLTSAHIDTGLRRIVPPLGA